MSVWLELGCGVSPRAGAINHDRVKHSEDVDVAWDLNEVPWPWENDSFDEVRAIDVMEHLKLDPEVWMDELWRITRIGGNVRLRVPAWDNPVSFRDPTHQRVFHLDSFRYWDPSHDLWRDFGRFYFDSHRWWKITNAGFEVGDVLIEMTPLKEKS